MLGWKTLGSWGSYTASSAPRPKVAIVASFGWITEVVAAVSQYA